MGRVVPVARRARDRAATRTATRALALPGEPLLGRRPDQRRDARRPRTAGRRAHERPVAGVPRSRRAAARCRLRRSAVPLGGAARWAVPVRIPRQPNRSLGTARATRPGSKGEQTTDTTAWTTDLILGVAPPQARKGVRIAVGTLANASVRVRPAGLANIVQRRSRRHPHRAPALAPTRRSPCLRGGVTDAFCYRAARPYDARVPPEVHQGDRATYA